MSIKPVDLQVMIPKITEVSKIHSDVKNKSVNLEQQAVILVEIKSKEATHQVNSQEKAKDGNIKEKERENQNKKKKNPNIGLTSKETLKETSKETKQSKDLLENKNSFDVRL